jgi:ABC-2 type transport system permease protein
MIRRMLAIIRKEIYHILRDPRTLGVLFLMPVLMVLLYGYALNMDINNIALAVDDRDNTPESRSLLRAFSGSNYFTIPIRTRSVEQVGELFRRREVRGALVIPRGFGEDMRRGPAAKVQLLVDGSDPTYGQAIVNYANAIVTLHSLQNPAASRAVPLEVREQFLFNPDLKSSNFIIPGLVAVILMMVCALLTSITLVREKETGTMDVLVVSPVRSFEIVMGKVIPYVGLALLDSVFILAFARLIFNIPLHGNLLLLLALSVVYIYCAMGIGLFISSMAKTQQVAMMAALVATLLPSIMLSGFIFPTFSMPAPIRAVTTIVPAKHYLEIIRGILLKSSTFDLLAGHTLFLAALGTLFVILSTLRFKTRVH